MGSAVIAPRIINLGTS